MSDGGCCGDCYWHCQCHSHCRVSVSVDDTNVHLFAYAWQPLRKQHSQLYPSGIFSKSSMHAHVFVIFLMKICFLKPGIEAIKINYAFRVVCYRHDSRSPNTLGGLILIVFKALTQWFLAAEAHAFLHIFFVCLAWLERNRLAILYLRECMYFRTVLQNK